MLILDRFLEKGKPMCGQGKIRYKFNLETVISFWKVASIAPEYKTRVDSQKIILTNADSSLQSFDNRHRRQISIQSVPFEFKIKNNYNNFTGSLMETKLCSTGCGLSPGLLAIAIDRNSPVITLQITSEWHSFDSGIHLPFELRISYFKTDQDSVLSNGINTNLFIIVNLLIIQVHPIGGISLQKLYSHQTRITIKLFIGEPMSVSNQWCLDCGFVGHGLLTKQA